MMISLEPYIAAREVAASHALETVG
jgi:hypothetical protein